MFDPSEILSGQNIAKRCDYVFSQMIDLGNGHGSPVISDYLPNFSGGELIFCKTDYILLLKQVLDAHIKKTIPLTIITHDSDYPVTDELVRAFSDRSVCWWGMNCESEYANPIPIGIANSYCPITLKNDNFKKNSKPTRLLYLNHRSSTNPDAREWLYSHFKNESWCTVRYPFSDGAIHEYREEMTDHKFILCPRGNGIDTHRLWEAMYCGVIPVVVRHRTHSNLERNLPILFVDHYKQVNEQLLVDTYEHYQSREWNLDMLSVSWWIDKIRNTKCQLI